MLVITRRVDQKLYINDCIEITIVEIRGDRVRLGIVAPPDVRVMRDDARKGSGPKDRAAND